MTTFQTHDMSRLILLLVTTVLAAPLALAPPSLQAQPRPQIDFEALPFNPRRTVVYRTPTRLTIDGKLDEPAWRAAEPSTPFVDIEGEIPVPLRTRMRMLWDDERFYVAAELDEPDVWATLKERDSVIFRDNDFELFIDPDGDTHAYYELEVNAFGTPWDLMLIQPYRDGGPGRPRVGHRRPRGRRRHPRHAEPARETKTRAGPWRSPCRGKSCTRPRCSIERHGPASSGG